MTVPAPHFLLFSEARTARPDVSTTENESGLWHFVLESVDGSSKLEATDAEPEVDPERLELLAIVRGLEALDQPSQVTLVTRSRSVTRGLRFGIDHWRANGWQWECFGKMAPIKDSDLWQRVDQALRFHDIRCRTWRFDPPDESLPRHQVPTRRERRHPVEPARRVSRFKLGVRHLITWFRKMLARTRDAEASEGLGNRVPRLPFRMLRPIADPALQR